MKDQYKKLNDRLIRMANEEPLAYFVGCCALSFAVSRVLNRICR